MSKDNHTHLEPCPICQIGEFRTEFSHEALSLAESLFCFMKNDPDAELDELSEPSMAMIINGVMQRQALLEIAALLRAEIVMRAEADADEEGDELH